MTEDSKVTGYTEVTTLALNNLLLLITNVTTIPESHKITIANFLGGYGGWVPVADTWTYASASTITVPSGAASIYSIGDKIRLKQGAGYKYYYVSAVADTVLTVTGGDDYTVANAAITDPAYSKAADPISFPQWFNWTPVLTGITGAQTGTVKFAIVGKILFLRIVGVGGTSNLTTFTMTLPFATLTVANQQVVYGAVDNGADVATGIGVNTNAASDKLSLYRSAFAAWTNSGIKNITGNVFLLLL